MLWENAVGIDSGNYGQDEGIAFIGNDGTLVIDRGGWQVRPELDYQNGYPGIKTKKFNPLLILRLEERSWLSKTLLMLLETILLNLLIAELIVEYCLYKCSYRKYFLQSR